MNRVKSDTTLYQRVLYQLYDIKLNERATVDTKLYQRVLDGNPSFRK